MDNKELIRILNNIAVLLQIKGENPFKSRAYSNVAEIISNQNIDIETEVRNNTLANISGFGDALQKKIKEYVETGKIIFYENLIAEVPESLVQITKINFIGPKKAKVLYDELVIKSIEELEQACFDNKLSSIKGFTEKSQEIILNSIQHSKASKGRFLQEQSIDEATNLLNEIRKIETVVHADFIGLMRRFSETITDIQIIAATDDLQTKEKYFSNLQISKISDNTYHKILSSGIPVTVSITNTKNYFWELHYKTGSDEYIDSFNSLLETNAYKIIDNCLQKNNQQIELKSEDELYRLLNIQFVPPELRESTIALEKARENKIPRLIEPSDLKGILHVHSKWSDGKNSIEEMALKAKELGFSYIAICDHSRSAGYANGLSIERVHEQHKEIDELNSKNIGIHIFKGIESDILNNGDLDYPDDVLALFDLVVASIHSSFRMNKSEMTTRIIKALKNQYSKILGHPTGRLLLNRQEYEVDIEEIINAAADLGKVIEINANPYRLDLSWQNTIYAKEKGVKIAINPDSHTTGTLQDIFIGVKVARKGWLEAADVINYLELNEFKKYIKK